MVDKSSEYYYKWLDKYVDPFINSNENTDVNYELKLEHTYRVKDNILELGQSINLDKKGLFLCELIGLYHDLGRFEQYSKFGTFSDSVTGSHGELSVQALIEYDVLKCLEKQEREITLKAIRYHNYFSVPDDETEEIKLFSRLIRDADKLDAFYLETKEDEKRKYDLGSLSSEKDYSKEIIDDVLNSRQVNFKNIKFRYDRRLSILGLIFDLYLSESFKIIKKNTYISRMFKDIEMNDELKRVQEHCENYIKEKVKVI